MNFRTISSALFISLTILISASAFAAKGGNTDKDELEARIVELEGLVADLQGLVASLQSGVSDNAIGVAGNSHKLQFVSVENGELNNLAGPHFIIEGANVHVRNGVGETYIPNGVGNLIVGYNEIDRRGGNPDTCVDYCPERTGSHNFVVGADHEYTNKGSVLVGQKNASHGPSTFTAGLNNTSSFLLSSVLGGIRNIADGKASTIVGGYGNVTGSTRAQDGASGYTSVVVGGSGNIADGWWSTVSGGEYRTTLDSGDWAAGSLLEDN